MKSRIAIVPIIVLLAAITARAQVYTTPKGEDEPTFDSVEDYLKFEPKVLEIIDYLENSPLKSEPQKRKAAAALMLQWLQGTPRVNLSIHTYVMPLCSKNKDLWIIFLGGCIRQALKDVDNQVELDVNLAGVRSLMMYYQKEKNMVRDPNVENVINLDKAGKLSEWLQGELAADPKE